MKLHIGCGGVKLPGYTNLDIIDENGAADEIIDCTDILTTHPEWEGKVEEILGLHVFEHFYYDEAVRALGQYYKLLTDGGRLVLEMPNFAALCMMVFNGDDTSLTMGYIFGSHSRDGQVHYWGWHPETLYKALKDAGFTAIELKNAQDYHAQERPCFRMEAQK